MGVVGGFALLSEHGKVTAAGLAVELELTVTGLGVELGNKTVDML